MVARGDRGSGSVLAIGAVGVLASVLVAALLLAGVLVAGQRARAAADLGALAGAGALVTGGPAHACPAAERVVTQQGGEVRRCAVLPPDPRGVTAVVELEVEVPLRGAAAALGRATARARAGGVPPTGDP